MIAIDHQDKLISIAVLGEFTLADFKEFEELVVFKLQFTGPIRLLMDLREMAGFTVDMVWEEVKFSRAHSADFERIGIVSDSEWVTWSAWLQRVFVTAEIRVEHDLDEVTTWLKN
jgi:hypothetical protein